MASRVVSLRNLRRAKIVPVGTVFLYAWVGEKDGPAPKPVNRSWRIAVYALAVSIIPTMISRRTLAANCRRLLPGAARGLAAERRRCPGATVDRVGP
jgi:hypothetical protein